MDTPSTEVAELRWFVPGHGPKLVGVRSRHRVDRYHLATLAPDSALKARGQRARLEVKVLMGRGQPVEVGGRRWLPERWVKSAGFDWPVPDRGEWATVDKRIWRAGGIEVCHLDLAGAPWWSLALKVRSASVAPLDPEVLGHLRATSSQRLFCSYPVWLLGQLPPERLASCLHRRSVAPLDPVRSRPGAGRWIRPASETY